MRECAGMSLERPAPYRPHAREATPPELTRLAPLFYNRGQGLVENHGRAVHSFRGRTILSATRGRPT